MLWCFAAVHHIPPRERVLYLFFAFGHYRFALYRQLGELGEEALRWALNSATLRSRRPVSMPVYCDTSCSGPAASRERRQEALLRCFADLASSGHDDQFKEALGRIDDSSGVSKDHLHVFDAHHHICCQCGNFAREHVSRPPIIAECSREDEKEAEIVVR